MTAIYIGPDLKPNDEGEVQDLIPDVPPTGPADQGGLCHENAHPGATGGSYEAGLVGPEANEMNPSQFFEAQGNFRPSTQVGFPATLVKVAGEFGDESILKWSTCTFSEAQKQWVRIDTQTNITATGPGSETHVGSALFPDVQSKLTLFLGTEVPSIANTIDTDGDGKPDVAIDPSECATITGSADPDDDTTLFPAGIEGISRHPTTDHPELAKNAAFITAGDLAIDPDGAVVDGCAAHDGSNLKEKLERECADGSVGGEAPNFFADDWDGDGCPDWDELDPTFVNGRDPFNPNDCDPDYTGSYTITGTVQAATDGTAGSYFHCIAAIVHTNKGTTNDLDGAMQCYLELDKVGPKSTVPNSSGDGFGNPVIVRFFGESSVTSRRKRGPAAFRPCLSAGSALSLLTIEDSTWLVISPDS